MLRLECECSKKCGSREGVIEFTKLSHLSCLANNYTSLGSCEMQNGAALTSLPLLCSSMVIRDLTLRSAASFGSFHLIRLLYDEYMYYLIEHRVAQAKGETPIAVMGEV